MAILTSPNGSAINLSASQSGTNGKATVYVRISEWSP